MTLTTTRPLTAEDAQRIRDAVTRSFDAARGDVDDAIGAALASAHDAWDLEDLRSSEMDRLDSLVDTRRRELVERILAELQEAAIAAALTFAEEHPGAPRATTADVA